MTEPPRNILIVIADQLAQRAVGAYGCEAGSTPHIDQLASQGSALDQYYCNTPLCAPSRTSFWTGRLPHQTGVVSNGQQYPCPDIPASTPTLGSVFSQAGYRTVHFGKQHDHGSLRGFECVAPQQVPVAGPDWLVYDRDTFLDRGTTDQCLAFLRSQRPDTPEPFVAVADLNNPHNICGWVGANAGPGERDIPDPLPPLPDNFEIHDIADRPLPIQYLPAAHRRLSQAAQWSPTTYRQYIAAYHRYVSLMDHHVGELLAALEASGLRENTLVVFFSDHGDGMACHRMVTKHTSFYEETNRVPFIMAGPGIPGGGRHIRQGLGSLIDLLPTLCDYADLPLPEGLPGQSLLPWFQGDTPPQPHDYVVGQWTTEWGHTIEPGRMIRTEQYKYTHYVEGHGEELFDLTLDPGETRNLAPDPNHQDVLDAHRKQLEQYCDQWADPFFQTPWFADPQWRRHPPGYTHHTGPSAPEAAG